MIRIDLELQKKENNSYLFLVSFYTSAQGTIGRCQISVDIDNYQIHIFPIEGEKTLPNLNPGDVEARERIYDRANELARVYVSIVENRKIYTWTE